MKRRSRSWIGAGCGVAALALWAALAAPARAQDEDTAARLEREVAALRAEVAALKAQAGAEAALVELERKVELLAGEVERLKLGDAAMAAGAAAPPAADRSDYGLGPAASKVYRAGRGVSIGGYGEALYQGFDSQRDDGSASARVDELDLVRAIVYFGYKFNDRMLFNSEIEWEHAKTAAGEPGEVAVEFAYLDYLWRPAVNLRGGLVLLPMGLINELHEPTVFPSTRRPGVESAILPTTWRENGFGVFGEAGPTSYRAYVVNGFDASGFTAAGLRGGRQNGARAKAEDLAWVGRWDLSAVPGLLAGVAAYVGDSGQDLGPSVETRIVDAHLDWRWRGLELRALWAEAELDDVAQLNQALGLTGNRSVGEEMAGYYVQAGYDLFSLWPRGEQSLTPFARWEEFDTQRRVPAGFAANPANDVESLTLGLAYQPLAQVLLKLDFQDLDNAAGTGVDQWNVAVGYVF